MASLARRRAAHFATFDAGEGQEGGGSMVHTGGTAARSLGPWSSAMQLADARESERERRENKIIEEARGKAAAAAPAWTPSRDVALGPRPACAVLPLSQITLRLVADLISQVETLWGLPDLVKSRVAAAVCGRRALTPAALRLFTELSPSEVCVPDCTQIDPDALAAAMEEAASPKLERLDLGLCGRGLTDAVAEQVAGRGVLSSLKALRLGGAYRLSDTGATALLRRAPALEELRLPQCSRIEGPAVAALPRLAPRLRVLDLTECRGLSADTLLTAIRGLPLLEELAVDGILEVDDAFLGAAAAAAPRLTSLSLRACAKVSDAGLAALAAACPALRRVAADECGVGTAGAAALAARCRGLEEVSLARCPGVDDAGVTALAALGTLRRISLNGATKVSGAGVAALAEKNRSTLQEVDLSWCRGVDAAALGALADSCPALRRLVLWGCTQADDSFLLGHSNDALEVTGRGEVPLPVAM